MHTIPSLFTDENWFFNTSKTRFIAVFFWGGGEEVKNGISMKIGEPVEKTCYCTEQLYIEMEK